jgi:hypothetical protein
MVDCLPTIHKALNSIPSTTKKREQGRDRIEYREHRIEFVNKIVFFDSAFFWGGVSLGIEFRAYAC